MSRLLMSLAYSPYWARYRSWDDRTAERNEKASAAFDRSTDLRKRGTPKAARTPMMTITTASSTRVKPLRALGLERGQDMLWTPNCTNVVVPLASAHIRLFSLFRPPR